MIIPGHENGLWMCAQIYCSMGWTLDLGAQLYARTTGFKPTCIGPKAFHVSLYFLI